MNNRMKIVWDVTKWEFSRFFKWKDMLKGTLFLLAFAVIGGLVGIWIASDSINVPDVAVHNYGDFQKESFDIEAIRFEDRTTDSIELLNEELESGNLDGILTIVTSDSATVKMLSERTWLNTLRQVLQEQRTELKLRELNIDQSVYSNIEEGMVIHTDFERGRSSTADKWVAGIAIFLVLIAVFLGFAYQFTAITGEKQQRITELVISAIEPQAWMDGKILGITAIGFTYVLYYTTLGLVGMVLLVKFTGAPFVEALALINPKIVILFLVLSVLGVLMINSFMAGMAATIDDPNTSQKSSLMMLPIYPVLFAFFAIFNPDSSAIQILGIFPLTSFAILPARMVMTDVMWWEPVIAIILLASTIWLFRVWAGKTFATGMMMYGKEPTLKEMWYWFRKS